MDPQSKTMDIYEEMGVIASGSLPSAVAMQKTLELVGSSTGWLLGRIAVSPNVVTQEQLIIIWHRPDTPSYSLSDFDWHTPEIHPMMVEGQPVVVADIHADREWSMHFAGLPPRFRGYLAYPIRPENSFVGVVEFFSDVPLELSPEIRGLLSYAAALLALVIERSRAQTRVRKSERRFRALFDNSYQFISLLDPGGTVIDVNDTVLKFSGLAAGELIGEKYWDRAWWIGGQAEKDRLRSLVERATEGELVRFESEILGATGQVVTCDFSIKPILNQQGQVIQLITEGRDITQLRRTLQGLRRAEQRLEEAQTLAQIGHWDYDLDGEEASWSKTLLEIFGLEREQVKSVETLINRVHPEDIDGLRQALELSFRAGKPYECYFRIIRPDQTLRMAFGAGGPIMDNAGERVRMTGIVQDITGRRRLEESLAHTVERLSALNTVAQSIASTRDLDKIYQYMLSAARAGLKADAVILFLHEADDLIVSAVEQEAGISLLGHRIADSAGVAGEVWTTGTAVWLSGDECRRRRSGQLARAASFDPGSLIAVPIRWQNQVLGVLEAANTADDTFSSDDVRLLQSIATWTAIAIGNAHQHHSLERRVRESEAIAAVSRSLSGTLEPQGILEMIVQTAHEIVPRSNWAIVHLLQGRPERLIPSATAGIDDDLSDYIIAPDEGAAGLALAQGRPINIGDTQEDPRPSSYAHMIGLRSLLVAPVQTHNHQLGTITLHCRQPNAFTEEDERLLTILAVQAGLAIENAYLFDTQRRARLVAELQRKRLRILTERLVSAQEEERTRISRELHDEAGQALTSLKISLELLQNHLLPEQEVLRSRLADLSALTGETMENLRTLAHDLRPPGLDTFGLNIALHGLCHDFAARTGLLISYSGVELPDLSATLALSIYRFAQEALTNVAKHAKAQNVAVELVREEQSLLLSIADDGLGFSYEPQSGQGGVGLVSMLERIDLLGGVLDIDTSPGKGTRLTARAPLDNPPRELESIEKNE